MTNMNTKIQWTNVSWSPVTGCSKVSPGCQHCYAETVAGRFWATQYPRIQESQGGWSDAAGGWRDGQRVVSRPRRFTDVQCHPDRLDHPLRWKRGRKIFVDSMSDLFHEDVPDTFIDQVFAVMLLCPRHTFQVLTKRPERMLDYLSQPHRAIQVADTARRKKPGAVDPVHHGLDISNWPLSNVWLGVSVEDQSTADRRIPLMLATPAAVRFLSCEPLLGPIDIERDGWFQRGSKCGECGSEDLGVPETVPSLPPTCLHCGGLTAPPIHWVIVGGESGPKARPCDLGWIRSIRDQCREASVSLFVKQIGAKPTGRCEPWCSFDHDMKFPNRNGADPSEWPEDLRIQEFPTTA